MEDLFRSYWWLLFPLGWFIASGFTSWLNYRRQRDAIEIVKRYADCGREPPPELLKLLDRPIDSDVELLGGGPKDSSGRGGHVFSVVLFAALSAGFGYAAWADLYGAGQAFLIVSFVTGALALASLASLAFGRPRA